MTQKKLITWALSTFVGVSLVVTAYRAARESRKPGATTQSCQDPEAARGRSPAAQIDQTVVAPKPGTAAKMVPQAAKSKGNILAYYFHGFARCQTCRKLEAYSQEAIETGFGPELKSGRIKWQAVNVEEPGNRHFIQDFKLTNKSVVLAIARGGIVKDWKNLSMIWELVGDKGQFLKYIQDEMRTYQVKL